MATGKPGLMLLLLLIFGGGVMAETRNSKIGNWDDNYLMFIDNFQFTGTQGRVELKLTNISFFKEPYPFINPIPTNSINYTSLSNMGFFLSQKFLTAPMAKSCPLNHSQIRYTLDNLQPGADSFDFVFSAISKPGDYILYYQNCDLLNVHVTMNARSSLYNLHADGEERDYLSPNESLVTRVFYPFLALLQFCLACVWAFQIPKFEKSKKKTIMCWLFVLVPFLRAWSLIFSMLRNLYVMKIGCADCSGPVLLTMLSGFLNQAPVGIFLVVFSTGLVMVKPSLLIRDEILILLEISAHLLLCLWNLWYQSGVPTGREYLYLYPGIITTFASMATNAFFHQLTVDFSLKFLREVARGNCPNATFENETPKSLLTFGEVLRSLFDTHVTYIVLQTMIVPLEIFSSRLCLIVTLKELAAMLFFVKVACHLRPELWILNLSSKDGKYDDIMKNKSFKGYDDIEKAEPLLLPYNDDIFWNYLEQEWDGISAGATRNRCPPYILENISYSAFFAGKK